MDCYITTETLSGEGFFQKQQPAGFRVFFKGIYIGKFRKFQGLLFKLKNFFWQSKSIFRNISHSFISCCCSVTKLCLIQHPSLPSPSLFPWVCSNSCLLSRWCHPTILCRPLLLSPSVFPSIRVFSNESVLCIRWSKYWTFTPVLPINIQDWFPLDSGWFDLLAVQGSLKNPLQHHSLRASILWRSALFTAELSHPYMTTGKTITLTIWTFVDKVKSLLFNTLSRFVRAFLLRNRVF